MSNWGWRPYNGYSSSSRYRQFTAEDENYERVIRGLSQRIYLLETVTTTRNDGSTVIHFIVSGTTGNVYTVDVNMTAATAADDARPATGGEFIQCTCPDYQRRHSQCKHVAFVLFKVLAVTGRMPDPDRRSAECREHLRQVQMQRNLGGWERVVCDRARAFAAAAPAIASRQQHQALSDDSDEDVDQQPNIIYASEEEVQRYRQALANAPAAAPRAVAEPANVAAPQVEQKPYVGEMCAICMDDMLDGDVVIWCQSTCGKSVHAECFTRWCEHKDRRKTVTCVHCRGAMERPAPPPQASPSSSQTYINIAQTRV